MRSFLLLILSILCLLGENFGDEYIPSTESVKLVVVEDEKPSSKSRKVVIESADPEDYLHETYYKEPKYDQNYIIEKVGKPNKEVTVDVKVRNPNKHDDENVKKRIDVDVKVKDDRQGGYFGEDIPDPRKFNIKVKIIKDPPNEEKKESLLIKLVKSARKYTGF